MHRIKKVVCVTFVIPFDVTLTRYQASYGTPTPFKNVLAAAKAIKSEGGYAAFGRGWTVMCTRRLSHSLTLSDSYRRKSRALYLFWARESPTQALPSQECSSSLQFMLTLAISMPTRVHFQRDKNGTVFYLELFRI